MLPSMISRIVSLVCAGVCCLGCVGAAAMKGVAPTVAPAAGATSASAGQATARAGSKVDSDAKPPDWVLTLRPVAASGRLRVSIETQRIDVLRWTLPSTILPASRGGLSGIEARDARQPLTIVREGVDGRRLRLLPEGALTPPLRITYEVAPTESSPCPFELTPDRALFCGAAVLAVPVGVEVTAGVAVHLLADGDYYKSAASSFGLAATTQVTASFAELGRAGFLFGDIQQARFDAHEGRDHAAWLGYFSFDPRWVAAEAAGVRTAVDRWLGIRRPADDPTVGLLFASSHDTTRRVAIRPLYRGALIQAGPSAVWSVRARIDLTRLLVQRTIGAAVTLDHPGAAWWFDEGVAHGIALQVLLDVGVVNLEEAAREVSSWLAEETLSAQSGAALAQLVSVATSGRPKALAAARRLLATRGALLAIALNGASGDGLQRAALQLLERASARAGTIRPAHDADAPSAGAFFAAGSGQPDAADIDALRAAFESGRPIPVRASDLSPCLAMVKRRIHAFDLGFTTRSTTRGDLRVVRVDPSGPAARAGLRAGDTIVSLEHVEGRSDVMAKVDVERDDGTAHASYLPRGAARSTRALAVASRRGACALDG